MEMSYLGNGHFQRHFLIKIKTKHFELRLRVVILIALISKKEVL
jgi:hypothetical protein